MLALREKLFDLRYQLLSPKQQQFVLASLPRSGSTLLMNYLAHHPKIKMYAELLNLAIKERHVLKEALACPRLYLKRRLYNHRLPPEITTIGFKLFGNHCRRTPIHVHINTRSSHQRLKTRRMRFGKFVRENYDRNEVTIRYRMAWKWLSSNHSLKVIHLKREDLLRMIISVTRAEKFNYWHAVSEKEIRDIPAVEIPIKSAHKLFNYIQRYRKAVDQLFKDHPKIEVRYEALAEDKTRELKRIFEFLELPYHPPSSRLIRLGGQPLKKAIKNYSELKDYFAKTPWSCFFTE